MSDSITIVTAFFPIGRGNWNNYAREDSTYIRFFRIWARIKNDLIVYTDPQTAQIVRKIRIDEFGLTNTRIIEVDDCHTLDRQLYDSLQSAASHPDAPLFHRSLKHPESKSADYVYVMLLKWWCMSDAVTRGYADGNVAWVDFGFSHGNGLTVNPDDFNFEWRHHFEQKIHLTAIRDLDDTPIFRIVRSMNTYITGAIVIAPAQMLGDLWNWTHDNAMALAKVGLIDDDQTILLMCQRGHPEAFNVRKGTYFDAMAAYSSQQFHTPEYKEKSKAVKALLKWWYGRSRAISYCLRWYRILRKEEYN